MYKHILVATDGSELSERSARHAVALAKLHGSKITAVTVTAPWSAVAIGEIAVAVPENDYEARAEANAKRDLVAVAEIAKAAGVSETNVHLRNAQPWRAIIAEAEKVKCDLIVMGSHGRRGLEGFLLGSETQKVLTHAKVPVLVYRD